MLSYHEGSDGLTPGRPARASASKRQFNRENGAACLCMCDFGLAIMRLCDGAHDGEAEA